MAGLCAVIKSSPAPFEISTARVTQAAWPYVYAFSPPGANVRICRIPRSAEVIGPL